MPSEYTEDAPGRLTSLAGGFDAFVPTELPPELDATPLLQPLSETTRLVGQFTVDTPPTLPIEVVGQFLLFQEAVASSRIEHLDVSIDQLYAYRDGCESIISDRARRDVETVSNYVDAYRQGKASIVDAHSVDSLCQLHKRLLGGVADDKRPGELRESQNYIGGRYREPTYVPPPPQHVSPLLRQTIAFSEDDPTYSALIDAALAHYQFEAIHPFLDGNGRTGRLWFLLSLCEQGVLGDELLPVSRYILRNRQQYTDLLLAVSQTGAWNEWLLFILDAVGTQAVETRDTLFALAKRYEQVTNTYDPQARSAHALSELLFEQPIFQITQFVERSEFAYSTINRTVEQFEDDGLVREATGRGRNRVFVATWLDEFKH
jgi:Fic family protein